MLFGRIRGVVKTGTSVIYITHRLVELRQIAQRVTVLRDGRVAGGGLVAENKKPQQGGDKRQGDGGCSDSRALSRPGGVVQIEWRISQEPKGSMLQLDWVESGGPLVNPPDRRGFGSDLIERCMGRSKTRLSYNPSGFEAHFQVMLIESAFTSSRVTAGW